MRNVLLYVTVLSSFVLADDRAATTKLAAEVSGLGVICFGGQTDRGDFDLFVMAPDGSRRTNITNTPDQNEGLPRYSPDGSRLLYRRVPRDEKFTNNQHGEQGELLIADSDGRNAAPFGKPGEYSWATWSPDGTQLACLSREGITFIDVSSRKVVSKLKRQGFFQQMTWSPDGKWLVGVSNGFGAEWSVARMRIETGETNAVSTVDCCTPDWFSDSERVIFSKRPGQWTQLWIALADGKEPRLVYAENGRHVYGGCVSPDGKYAIFTGNAQEDGDPGSGGAPMGIVRLSDTPIIRGDSADVKAQFPAARAGPVLEFPNGFEPCWSVKAKHPSDPK